MGRRIGGLFSGSCFVAILMVASSGSAQVFSPFNYGGTLGWPYGFRQFDSIPYYSLFPPVYYSQPVARTYGYSPFAYPPGVMTPEIAAPVEPQVIENPYVPQSTGIKPSKIKQSRPPVDRNASVSRPKVVVNPYVTSTQVTSAH